MIVLDTNVISELMHEHGNEDVRVWMARQRRPDLRTTAISVAEIGYGLDRMPEGRRRQARTAAAARVWAAFPDFVLPFDRDAADAFGALMADRRRAGRPMHPFDAQIGAICIVRAATLATRNVKDFADSGIQVVDPWTAL